MEFIINDLNEIPKVARTIIDNLKHNIICFDGEMGAGKTTFIKEMVQLLGSDDVVSSPTFSIVNEYETNNGKVFHFDLYRLNTEEEALDFGIEDYLYSDAISLIEWPSKIENLIPENYHQISIENQNGIRYLSFN